MDPARSPERPLLLLAMPEAPQFRVVRRALQRELEGEIDFSTFVVGERTTVADLSAQVRQLRPACLVVMDNPVLALYRSFAEGRPPGDPPPPAVVVMTPFFAEELHQIKNTTGVAYEIPGVTAFVKLRSVIARAVLKVGVLHRSQFRPFIEKESQLAAREHIELVAFDVGSNPDASAIRAFLTRARESDIDALWVLNDRKLMRTARFIREVWRPQIHKFTVPVIVGLSTLVAAKTRFGNFAVIPDHAELGVQTARLIFRVQEAGWRAEDIPVELPISTVTIANLAQLKIQAGLQAGAASRVDKVTE